MFQESTIKETSVRANRGLALKISLVLFFCSVLISWALPSFAFAATNSAQFVSQSVPTSMVAGKTYNVSVTMKNTGTNAWTKATNYKLGSQNPQDNLLWGLGRVDLSSTDAIAPGQSKTFTFNIKAPTTAGNYNFQWRMLKEYVVWFGNKSPNLTINVTPSVALPNNAQFISQSVPTTMTAGQVYSVSIIMKNTGTTTWTEAQRYRLGRQDNLWQLTTTEAGQGRVKLSSTENILPRASKTFTFNVKAPAAAGSYNFQWRMVKEYVTWFGDSSTSSNINVQVVSNNAQFISQSVPAAMTAGQNYNVSVTMKNIGSTTWTKSLNYKLGSQNPQDNGIWGAGRALLSDTDSISPGQSKTFTFNIKAPTTAGNYNFQWRMLKENVAWFGAYSQNASIAISSSDTTAPTGSIAINGAFNNPGPLTLNLTAKDNTGGTGISKMQFSNNSTTWSTPERFATSKIWPITQDFGFTKVYTKFSDQAGNWSPAYNATTFISNPGKVNGIRVYSVDINSDDKVDALDIQLVINGALGLNIGSYNADVNHDSKIDALDIQLVINGALGLLDTTSPVIVITSPVNKSTIDTDIVELKGTIDGVAFSETRKLRLGENTLTKTATDASGNIGSASIIVYYAPSTLIGPQGGKVTSADGKIKLIIPQGALSSSIKISVSAVDISLLKSARKSLQQTILSVAKCDPSGTQFSKPVTLIYKLDKAQVPGTPVSLGLYNPTSNEIISVGQVSKVQADNYTVNFSISHFSTYVALQSMAPTGAPIGGGVKIPLPDMFTGSFSHSVPITVAPGRKGMQPALALAYRSSNPNSWTGVGFSLNSGYIVRSTRLGPPSYNDTQDTFYFVTDAGTTELVNLIDNLYQAKVESSFTKFYKEADDSWRVIGKDGSVLRLGQDSDSKEGSDKGTFSWYLTKAIDTNGNYISYTYYKDQGKIYLSRIDYTGNENGTSSTNTVEFFLESREDIVSSYISSAKVSTLKRLKEIQVKVRGDLVWRYALEYGYSPDTNRSILKSVTQYGSDDKSLPKQVFSYQSAK